MPHPVRLLAATPATYAPHWSRTSRSLSGLGDKGAFAINAGGGATAGFGADVGYSGGDVYTTTNAIDMSSITGVPVPETVFQTERYGEFTYTITGFEPGSAQEVTLYFAEIYNTEVGNRIFDVAINGAKVLSAFDILATAGGANKAIALGFATAADASGAVVIAFTRGAADVPKVSGIVVSPMPSSVLLYVGAVVAIIVAGVAGWYFFIRRKRSGAAPLTGTSSRRRCKRCRGRR
jgi:Malectin domain